MKITRFWAMPNKWTFLIPPIADLVHKYVGDGKGWIDPFAGENSPAEITNDLNPERPTIYHKDATEFLESLDGLYSGCLFDPPYSLGQAKQCYEDIGREFMLSDAQDVGRWVLAKKRISEIIKPSGFVITFGWNTQGIGKINGFEIIEILLVCHGSSHNDTIVTVEQKVQSNFGILT